MTSGYVLVYIVLGCIVTTAMLLQNLLDTEFHFLLQEEIEIEAKSLRVGKAVAVINVELRKKSTGKIVAQGRHTKYLPASSKL